MGFLCASRNRNSHQRLQMGFQQNAGPGVVWIMRCTV
ncbi:hypothetical protein CMUS01_10790 [Colletotrichum musicola]|uniref:Uncharacterized protein n=1 Tax=Colletotrichum musicola TaxID=2175873 RepID=A0A8H6K172_9PEZI|nr:hypothetical protein CMUS01_10790 [Colletotrichum musicola]